jgi:ABC-type transport system involved in multi-copper enzyme maturation permease subunit
LLSLVIVNALAVTAVTTERDGKSLDLLLTTDLSPKEFVFGKLGGVFSVATLMIALPLALVFFAWLRNGMITENLIFISYGLIVMDLFVATLGLHCGMRYANSQTAVAVSLGTVFFLFLGVISCMLLMISFSGSFQVQLGPFLALILGGGVGLYMALGAHNPSTAIGVVSFLVPFFTFYAITSFLLRFNLSVFLVLTVTYGFTTWAMLIPAISEFDFALDQTAGSDD